MQVGIQSILQDIVELGFLSVRNSLVIDELKPISNLYADNRWDPTVQYIRDYVRYHEDFAGDFFLCVYDGWREYTEPIEYSGRKYVPWQSLSREEQLSYITIGSKGEPRFSHINAINPVVYPELPLQIISYNRHKDDKNVILIPDYEFIVHQFAHFLRYTISNDISMSQKIPKIFWRGTEHVMLTEYKSSIKVAGDGDSIPVSSFLRMDQRHLLHTLSENVLCEPDIRSLLNVSFIRTPMSEFFNYKYVMDVDGYVSAWSGNFWKLYSNSVVIKAPSSWEQWYYEDMKPFVHYLPLKSLHPRDIQEIFTWCETFQQRCYKIALDSSAFVRRFTYEYAVKDYIIH